MLQGHLIMARSRQGYFSDTDQEILILKSILSMNLCQVLEVSLLFLCLDMFFLVTSYCYRSKVIEIKFLSGFVSSTSRSLIVARGKHGPFSGLPLIQIKGF